MRILVVFAIGLLLLSACDEGTEDVDEDTETDTSTGEADGGDGDADSCNASCVIGVGCIPGPVSVETCVGWCKEDGIKAMADGPACYAAWIEHNECLVGLSCAQWEELQDFDGEPQCVPEAAALENC